MKSSDSGLSIQRFKNLSGTITYRVFRYSDGERVRRNFKPREEAVAEKTLLENQSGAGRGRPSAPPTETDHAMAEIVNAFLRWPLPGSVCADKCVTQPGDKHRSGPTC